METKAEKKTFWRIFDNRRFRLFLLLILTPGFWWIASQFNSVAKEWLKTPVYVDNKIHSIFSAEKLNYVEDLRWENFNLYHNNFRARFFYNKLTVLTNEFFDLVAFFSPRFYFQGGDASQLSPPGVEPLPVILFPFWLLGIFNLIKQKEKKMFFGWFVLGLLAFLTGQRNFNFLWPLLLFNLWLANLGWETIKSSKGKGVVLLVFFIYGGYLFGRALWLLR